MVTLPASEDCHTLYEQELLLPATTEKTRTERLNVRAGALHLELCLSVSVLAAGCAAPSAASLPSPPAQIQPHCMISSGCCVPPGLGATRGRTWLRRFESGSTASMAPRAVGSSAGNECAHFSVVAGEPRRSTASHLARAENHRDNRYLLPSALTRAPPE